MHSSSSKSSAKSTAAYTNTATTGTAKTKATNAVNTSASKSSTASDIFGSVVINYATTALETIATTVAKSTGTTAGSVVSKIPAVAVVGAIAGVMVDCQKYDGVTAAKAAAITVMSTAALVGVGIGLAATGLPLAATIGISIVVGTALGFLSNKLKTKVCG